MSLLSISDPLQSIDSASVYGAFAMKQFEPSSPVAKKQDNESSRVVRDEIRASLAGSVRSGKINETYIEALKTRAEEQAVNRRALRSRTQVDGMGAKASIDLTALKNGPEAKAPASNSRLETAQESYRANLG